MFIRMREGRYLNVDRLVSLVIGKLVLDNNLLCYSVASATDDDQSIALFSTRSLETATKTVEAIASGRKVDLSEFPTYLELLRENLSEEIPSSMTDNQVEHWLEKQLQTRVKAEMI